MVCLGEVAGIKRALPSALDSDPLTSSNWMVRQVALTVNLTHSLDSAGKRISIRLAKLSWPLGMSVSVKSY